MIESRFWKPRFGDYREVPFPTSFEERQVTWPLKSDMATFSAGSTRRIDYEIERSGFPFVAVKEREATMSTPFRHAKHIDPALMYAPPRVRGRGLVPTEPFGPEVKNSDHGSAPLESRADRAIVRARRRLALDPECVPEPPQSQPDGRFYRRIAVPVVGILGLAAVIAWVVVVSIPSVRSLLKTDVVRAGLQGTSVSTDLAEQNAAKVARESGNLLERSSRSDPSEVTAVAPTTSVPVAPGHVLSSAPNRTSPEFVTRQLDRDELASMCQRADDFIKSGDLSSARLLLERGAEAGDARATLTLAGTFDPNVLKTLGFQEGVADIAMARFWYDRAQKLDAAEAPRRIQELATASVK